MREYISKLKKGLVSGNEVKGVWSGNRRKEERKGRQRKIVGRGGRGWKRRRDRHRRMEEDPTARKARLRALKEAALLVEKGEQGLEGGEGQGEELDKETEKGQRDEEEKHQQEEEKKTEEQESGGVRFRNYIPRNEALQGKARPPPPPPTFQPLAPATPALLLESSEDPMVSIVPRKPNWDLRRDVAKRMEKLEKRTQRAMILLMQEEEDRRRKEAEEEEEAADKL